MNKTELESKHIAELHALAAEAGVPKYRMLRREELIEALAGGNGSAPAAKSGRGDAKPRERRERGERRPSERGERAPRQRRPRPKRETAEPAVAKPKPKPEAPAAEPVPTPSEPASASERPRRRRRRRFGRRRKGVGIADLLLPPSGRQTLLYGESPAACTAMLREVAAEISGAAKGPDPIALLVDPSPEELADWKREAPEAEIVAAAQARHASDALEQARRRAESGEDVILLVDSLTKLEDADVAKEIFDGAKGKLTVVAALVRD